MGKKQKEIAEKIKITPHAILLLILFIVIALVVLFPIFCITLASFKPSKELLRFGLNIKIEPEVMSLNNFIFLFTGKNSYFMWFKNSIVITAVQASLTLIVSAVVGYGFAMYDFKYKNQLFMCVILIMMIPMEIIMLPLYKQMIGMKLIDTIWGIILPFVASPAPIFFFRQYLSGIPRELMEAGRIDGCSEYGIFGRIILPLMAPSFAAMGIFVGMSSWNGFLWPLIVLRSQQKFTLPIGLATLITPYGNNYDVLIAGSVMAILPILVVFLFFQQYFIEGMTAGGVKG
ncbi:carbohydrate ABC transporter permease [Cellulosilyticum sp. I15G10I2]|uniref:carbohydrate ABC transporter permease n=1 Tax=Cellulosilyticum sp. I15G10I2 TaxID=1892843 RepID=UPI00085C564D|nr:carbohydrate ABC transporter permease [Cellulosilyticum sp. I15G10I2]